MRRSANICTEFSLAMWMGVSNSRGLALFAIGYLVGLFTALSIGNIFPTVCTPTRPRFGSITDDPVERTQWNDFENETHKDEMPTLASKLKETVRVLCWVMTSPTNIETKARHVNATWGQRCNVLLFMSSQPDASLPAIGLNISEGRYNLWGKTKAAFKYVYEHHFYEADWFLKADDDTYAVIENLRYLLKDYDPDEPIYFGRRFRPFVKEGYMSGGAGYVLSREALKRFVTKAIPYQKICSPKSEGYEDVEIGKCLENTGVRVIDSRDELGRERFHPFSPEKHLAKAVLSKDVWFQRYNYNPIREGLDCCSDYSISFHYIPPNMMYVFEYLIYHMKPYGLNPMSDRLQTWPLATVADPAHALSSQPEVDVSAFSLTTKASRSSTTQNLSDSSGTEKVMKYGDNYEYLKSRTVTKKKRSRRKTRRVTPSLNLTLNSR